MDYTFYPQDQTFLMQCSFSDPDHHQHQLRQNGKREQISFGAFKNSFVINIKSISNKEVKLSTKGHMQKNSFEIVLRYSFEIKFKTSTKYRAWFTTASSGTPIEKYHPPTTCTTYPQLLLWKPTMLQISKPLTSNLVGMCCLLDCNLICQINFNICKSSHWKWNVFMLRKKHIRPLLKIFLIRSWIPFLLTI